MINDLNNSFSVCNQYSSKYKNENHSLIFLINQRRLGDCLEYLEKLGIEEDHAVLTIGMLQRFGGAR
jgi:hypothetical protein